MISVVKMFVRPLLLSVLLINLLEAIPLQKNGKEVLLNNELGLTLLQTLNTEDNAFFSPLSSTQTLLKVLKKSDLKKVLDIKEDEDGDEDIKALTEGIALLINKINLKEEGATIISRVLKSSQQGSNKDKDNDQEVMEVDFKNKKTSEDLNSWVKEKTKEKIPRLLKDGFSGSEALVSASLALFHQKWQKGFKSGPKKEFHNFLSYHMPGLVSKIPFMTKLDDLRAKTFPQLKSSMVEIPYASPSTLSMILVLPQTQEDLQFIQENMTSSDLNTAVEDLMSSSVSKVRLNVPKFKLETDYDLKDSLQDVYDVNTLSSNHFLHKAMIDVNEEGVAYSDINTTAKGDVKDIVVDKPFVFMIRDKDSGLNVFMGRVLTLVDEELLGLGFI